MARYTVHARPGPDALEKAEFVPDGFSFTAFLFGPLWLFAKGAWRAGLISGFGLLVAVASLGLLRLPDEPVIGVWLLVNLLIGFEGSTFRRWELARRGFREIGLVAGGDLDTLEQRFFAEQAREASVPPVPRPGPGVSVPAVIGLFPNPGGSQGPLR